MPQKPWRNLVGWLGDEQTMFWSLSRWGDDEDDDDSKSLELSEEDDADQQKIRKQVNFPPEIERSDIHPSTLVTKVSRAIQKRIARLDVHKEKLDAIPAKTDVQTKSLCGSLFCVPWWWCLAQITTMYWC